MNATRAATIRGRAWVGGVVSLGRVQTPTLALIVKREREIQAFVPEPYWLVDAPYAASVRPALPAAAGSTATRRGSRTASAPTRSSRGRRQGRARSSRSSARSSRERAPLLYDLTSLQRDANRRFGFSARRTLRAAQSLYEGKKAITYPRTSSRCLSGDLVPQLKPTAATLVGRSASTRRRARFVLALDQLPLGRVVNDAKVDDHHAIIPTDVEHDVDGVHGRRAARLRPRRAPLPRRLPPAGALRAHDDRHGGRGRALPHARQDHARAGLARRLRAGGRRGPKRAQDEDEGEGARAAAARAGPDRRVRRGRERAQGDAAAAALQRGDAARRRWRRPASSSTTRSCARR